MATFEKCDGGCGKISPDYSQRGPHISNHWIEITVKRRGRWSWGEDKGKTLLLCEECFAKAGLPDD